MIDAGGAAQSIAAFDNTGIFLAAGMRFSARRSDILAFLALGRSLTDHRHEHGHGIAVVRNHVWSHGDPEGTIDARLVRPFDARGDDLRLPAVTGTRH
jgi:hypothetical protein